MAQPLLNVGELITDPDFCQNFQIKRREGTWNKGRFETTEEVIDTYGIIDPQTTKELVFDANGSLIKGYIKVYTHLELYTAKQEKTSAYNPDLVIWQNQEYIVVDGQNYSDYGYYGYTAQLKEANDGSISE